MRTSLNICSWNVGGLLSEHYNKTTDKDFLAEFNNFDIVLLTETHVGYEHKIHFVDFNYYPFCRHKSRNNRYFGGLGILIRKGIKKGIKILNDGTSEYQWIKLCKDFFNFKRDIYLCIIYYAPKNNTDILELLEKNILEKYKNLGDIILTGDFNARTGSEDDHIAGDSNLHIPVNHNNYNVDLAIEQRVSQDNTVDQRGKDLLEFCICNQIRILNGRCFGDSSGNFTCIKPNGCSVVDYVLVSQNLFHDILYMGVSDFKANFSDCHCKLSFKILASFDNNCMNNVSSLHDFPLRYMWKQ